MAPATDAAKGPPRQRQQKITFAAFTASGHEPAMLSFKNAAVPPPRRTRAASGNEGGNKKKTKKSSIQRGPLNIPATPPKLARRPLEKAKKRETLKEIAKRVPVEVVVPYFNYPLRKAAQVSKAFMFIARGCDLGSWPAPRLDTTTKEFRWLLRMIRVYPVVLMVLKRKNFMKKSLANTRTRIVVCVSSHAYALSPLISTFIPYREIHPPGSPATATEATTIIVVSLTHRRKHNAKDCKRRQKKRRKKETNQ